MNIAWLRFWPNVPEYGRYDEDDIALLAEWYYEFEEYTEEQLASFRRWLDDLPLGVMTPVPNHDGYRIIKAGFNET